MTRKIRWGIISTARIGARHVIPAIQQSSNGVVAAVASRDLARAQDFAAAHGISKAYGSYEEMIADPEIDAIYNPLPNGMHGEWSIACAEGGKHVLCEKPLARAAAEAQQMADVFAQKGLLLSEAFMYRFHPQTDKVKELVDSGALGKLQFIQATFNFMIGSEEDIRLDPALAGGALMDVGCYCLNIMRHLTGEEPVEARALADFGARSGVDERMVGVLRFPSGVMGHFDCSFRTLFTQTYEVRGADGRILVERAYVPFRPDPEAPVTLRLWRRQPGSEAHEYREIEVPRANHYVLMVEDFAAAILEARAPRFGAADGVANMRAIDLLYAAARGS
ncbi:MAG: Gfo/Idh/MocA family oxidoreductase [Chloroflexi bacterium]|nr:Gfo/Idh/MocA family oxidoreductase [Chloroflexota bacterium]